MKFELWKHQDDGICYTLVAVDENYRKQREFMQRYEPDSELLLTIEANSWDEACSQRNDYLGWGLMSQRKMTKGEGTQMKNEIELPIEGNSKLRIIVGLNDWSQCFLKTDDKQISLGADAIGIIATRLMQNLNRQNERIAGYHQGYELHFVLTLSETHNTLYCAFDQDGRILFWQDKWAKWFWSGRLSHKEYETWCKRLEKLC